MTNYYYCDVCDKTSEQEHCKVTINDQLICPHCLEAVEFAFSVCTADSPEPSLGFCDGCDELEAELHLVDGDWLCDKCKAAVIAVQEDKAKAQTMRSIAINTRRCSEDDLEEADHWDMIKARVFIIFVCNLGLFCRMGPLCIIKSTMGSSCHMRRSCSKAIWTKMKCVRHWRTSWATRTKWSG